MSREAQLTVGTLLLFAGALGAIAASTYNSGAGVAQQTVDTVIFGEMPKLIALLISEVVFTVVSFIGAAMVWRNR